MKNIKLSKIVFYILSFTWGISVTFLGLILSLILLFKYKPKRNIYGWYFEIGYNWGGFNLGLVSIVPINPTEYILSHEFGHSVQNCIYGPFVIFLVIIPSVIRYWYREFLMRTGIKKREELPDYYEIWFEKQASCLGNNMKEINKFNGEKYMNKRPQEIEEAMDIIDTVVFNHSNNALDAWNIVYDYITHLEYTLQEMIITERRICDDGK